jgi:hypothetical protein
MACMWLKNQPINAGSHQLKQPGGYRAVCRALSFESVLGPEVGKQDG